MAASISFVIETAMHSRASLAAKYLSGFHRDVAVEATADRVVLRSVTNDASELETIWRTALANELRLEAGRETRIAAHARLAR